MSELINADELQQLKEIMEDEFEILVSLFIEDSTKLIADMQSANKSGDNDALRIAAHTLKGSSANMCIIAMTELSKKLETKAKNNDLAGSGELIEKLSSLHPQVAEILTAF